MLPKMTRNASLVCSVRAEALSIFAAMALSETEAACALREDVSASLRISSAAPLMIPMRSRIVEVEVRISTMAPTAVSMAELTAPIPNTGLLRISMRRLLKAPRTAAASSWTTEQRRVRRFSLYR